MCNPRFSKPRLFHYLNLHTNNILTCDYNHLIFTPFTCFDRRINNLPNKMVVPYPYTYPLHHSDCGVMPMIPQPNATQKTLINKNGFLSIAAPLQPPPIPRFPPRPLRRSPLPKSVRNIMNIPTFTTTDRSLTSFHRFPPEIRLEIYGYLLISEFPIRYSICPIKKILLYREGDDWEPKHDAGSTCNRQYWIRHGIFPAILEVCRMSLLVWHSCKNPMRDLESLIEDSISQLRSEDQIKLFLKTNADSTIV